MTLLLLTLAGSLVQLFARGFLGGLVSRILREFFAQRVRIFSEYVLFVFACRVSRKTGCRHARLFPKPARHSEAIFSFQS